MFRLTSAAFMRQADTSGVYQPRINAALASYLAELCMSLYKGMGSGKEHRMFIIIWRDVIVTVARFLSTGVLNGFQAQVWFKRAMVI